MTRTRRTIAAGVTAAALAVPLALVATPAYAVTYLFCNSPQSSGPIQVKVSGTWRNLAKDDCRKITGETPLRVTSGSWKVYKFTGETKCIAANDAKKLANFDASGLQWPVGKRFSKTGCKN